MLARPRIEPLLLSDPHKHTSSLARAALALLMLGCGSEPHPSEARHTARARSAPSTEAAPQPSTSASASASAEAPAPELAPSPRFEAKRVFDKPVVFLITGEQGRLAVLANEAGATVPHRFEGAAWQRLELPEKLVRVSDASKLGIYFGRDNRPRLMGYQGEPPTTRMVYLRFKDGAWHDQRSELGGLASDTAALFGVLGEADPEVVCKIDAGCLLKSRKGWKDVRAALPPTAVVRAFDGRGYALTQEGVFRADDSGFVRVGPAAPWTSAATGFWVGAGGAIAVAEPAADRLHTLEGPSATWQSVRSPIAAPGDVAGPASDRWIAGKGGLAHLDATGTSRVGERDWSLARVIVTPQAVVAGGPAGVVVATAK